MNWVIFCIIAVFVILFFPLFWQFRFYINVLQNIGVISISLFGIKIKCYQIELTESAINVLQNNKDKKIQIDLLDKHTIFLQCFIHRSIKYTLITRFDMFCTIAKYDDAFITNMFSALFMVLFDIAICYLYTIRGQFPCYLGLNNKCEQDEVKIASHINICFCPIFILIVLIQSINKTKKVVKIYERYSRQ